MEYGIKKSQLNKTLFKLLMKGKSKLINYLIIIKIL